MERQVFLAQVALAARRHRLPESPTTDPGLLVPPLPEVDLEERFIAALEAVDGVAHRGEDPAEVIAALAARHGTDRYLSWDPEHLQPPDLADRLAERGLERIDDTVPADPNGRRDHQLGYLPVTLGVTGAEAALAESGSILVRSGPGRSRMASLVPLVHVAVVRRDTLHRSLAHWAEHHAAEISEAANLVFITGPSRTGDIEQNLNLGVHGPRHLHVVLI